MTGRRILAPLLAVCALLLGLAGPAQAAGYRYWSYWESDGGAWTYATQGPATARPADGEVNGYRFAVSAGTQDAQRPRRAPDFDAICASTPAKDGTKRVGVVIDFGTAADAPDDGSRPPAPRSACARVGKDATGADALAAVAKPLRYNNQALLCAISGYPRTGCGEQVSTPASPAPTGTPARPDATASPGGDQDAAADGRDGGAGPSVGVAAGLAAVAVLGAAAVWQARRRRR
ncbi:SCO2322 family protein [Streptomyces sp. NPDC015131]|uniref:SCO2322 family protein n=1 Tax=Streptomyces sp. NPDC015131 TaxID=3364941 RepID=UPI0036FB7934